MTMIFPHRRNLNELPTEELYALLIEHFEDSAEKTFEELRCMGEPETLQDRVDQKDWMKSHPEMLIARSMVGAACKFLKENSPGQYHAFLKAVRDYAAQEEEDTDYLATIPSEEGPKSA